MKNKKDRSGRIALIASLIVILLVGASVFSLYSLGEHGVKNNQNLQEDAADDGTGKLLTRYEDTKNTADELPVITGTIDQDSDSAAPADGADQTVTAEGQETGAVEGQPDVSGEEQQADNDKTQEGTGGTDVSGTALDGSVYTGTVEPAVSEVLIQDNFSDSVDAQEGVLMAGSNTETEEEEWYPADNSSDETGNQDNAVYDTSWTQGDTSSDDDWEENGEWLFDYDTEEWYFVEDNAGGTWTEETSIDNSHEDGEWLYDEASDEWYFETENHAAGGDEEDTGNTSEETGEWLFDYDTEEWYYVENSSTADDDKKADEQKNDEQKNKEEPGEWLFDYDTEEWYYVENPDYAGADEEKDQDQEQKETKETGAWLLNEETGEWYYDEDAPVESDDETDSKNDEEKKDEEEKDEQQEEQDEEKKDDETEGTWVYDEESGEWIYVEGTSEKTGDDEKTGDNEETGDDKEEDNTQDLTTEETEETSLGEEIVDYAMNYVGVTPYVWAGDSLVSGTDCSGFVHLIYDNYGIFCSQASMAYDGGGFGTRIGLDELETGDIVVYGGGDHVAIYAGNGYVVHCSSPENGTVYWNMNYRSDASWGLRVLP